MTNSGNFADWMPLANAHIQAHHQRMNDLREEADIARLAREYRQGHPEVRLRYRLARVLRRIADRLAPMPADPTVRFRVIPGSQPSPTH